MAVAGIHLFDAEHLVHLHACFLLTGQASPTGNQQVGIVGGDKGALASAHRTVFTILGGQVLTGHGKTGYPDGGRMTAHQRSTGLDGDDGAEIPQVDLAMPQLLRFEDPFGRGLHQPLITSVLTIDGRLAVGNHQLELTAGGGLLG